MEPDAFFDTFLYDPRPGRRAAAPSTTEVWSGWWAGHARSGDRIVRAAARQGFVLTTRQVRELGISRQAARTAVRRANWTVAARGIVAPLCIADPDAFVVERRLHALRAAAAVLARLDLAASGRSSAIVHGLPTMRVPPLPEVTTHGLLAPGRGPTRHVFGASSCASAVTTWYGACVMTTARTVVDLARHDRFDGIMAVDAALRERLVHPFNLELELIGAAGWPGVVQAREIIALACPRAESPLESITRLRLHDDGFEAPEPQFWIGADRVDFCWKERRLVLEADGRGKYSDDKLWDEKRREQRLRQAGYRVERVIWSDVTTSWPATRARLWAAYRLPGVWLIN